MVKKAPVVRCYEILEKGDQTTISVKGSNMGCSFLILFVIFGCLGVFAYGGLSIPFQEPDFGAKWISFAMGAVAFFLAVLGFRWLFKARKRLKYQQVTVSDEGLILGDMLYPFEEISTIGTSNHYSGQIVDMNSISVQSNMPTANYIYIMYGSQEVRIFIKMTETNMHAVFKVFKEVLAKHGRSYS